MVFSAWHDSQKGQHHYPSWKSHKASLNWSANVVNWQSHSEKLKESHMETLSKIMVSLQHSTDCSGTPRTAVYCQHCVTKMFTRHLNRLAVNYHTPSVQDCANQTWSLRLHSFSLWKSVGTINCSPKLKSSAMFNWRENAAVRIQESYNLSS